MNYEVTLAMPVYDVEDFVEASLLSALNQSFESIEFLIIDDKGHDNSMNVINKVIDCHPRGKHVRIVDHVANKGTGATKNSAIKEATGKYLFFMDSDDILEKDCIKDLYEKIQKEKVDVVIASWDRIGLNGDKVDNWRVYEQTIRGEYAIVKYMECYPQSLLYLYKENIGFFVQTWNKLYRLDMLRNAKVECVPYHRNEDPWFDFQLIANAKSIAAIDKVTYHYLIREGSTVTKPYSDFYQKQDLEICEHEIDYYSGLPLDRPQFLLEFYYARVFGLIIPRLLCLKEIDKETLMKRLEAIMAYDKLNPNFKTMKLLRTRMIGRVMMTKNLSLIKYAFKCLHYLIIINMKKRKLKRIVKWQ